MRSQLSHLTNSVIRATTGLEANGGRGSNGGVWEWTSTPLDSHDGLSPTEHFPGYSTDFFDGKHHVVVSLAVASSCCRLTQWVMQLGASYATIPRLAGRRTIRNFYQPNYPYPWVGARVVYDA
jgi:formylglycine-generating enzyme required for sulfatase activity